MEPTRLHPDAFHNGALLELYELFHPRFDNNGGYSTTAFLSFLIFFVGHEAAMRGDFVALLLHLLPLVMISNENAFFAEGGTLTRPFHLFVSAVLRANLRHVFEILGYSILVQVLLTCWNADLSYLIGILRLLLYFYEFFCLCILIGQSSAARLAWEFGVYEKVKREQRAATQQQRVKDANTGDGELRSTAGVGTDLSGAAGPVAE